MSILLKIIAGLLAAIGALGIILAILGATSGRAEAAIQLLVLALVFAAVARLLDNTAAIGRKLDHIQIQVDEIRWEHKRAAGQP
jgi:phosphatidylserine synthase